jgi:hypothetical protein
MAKKSPLRNAQANSISVCGRLLSSGQSTTVNSTAVGTRERALAKRGKIRIRPSNVEGSLQITCTL